LDTAVIFEYEVIPVAIDGRLETKSVKGSPHMRISPITWLVVFLSALLGGIVGFELGHAEGLRIVNRSNDLRASTTKPLTIEQINSNEFTVNMFSLGGTVTGVMCVMCLLGSGYVVVTLSLLWRRANRPPETLRQLIPVTVAEQRETASELLNPSEDDGPISGRAAKNA
jgi:hypothetical protein